MKKISQLQWRRYKDSEQGKETIAFFEKAYSDECTVDLLLEIAKHYDPQFFHNSSKNDEEQWKEVIACFDGMISDIFKAGLVTEKDNDYCRLYDGISLLLTCKSEEEYKTAIQLIIKDQTTNGEEKLLVDVSQTDVKRILSDNLLLSLILYAYSPEYFVPNFFVMQFIYFKKFAEKYELEIPDIPNRADYKERWYYYLDMLSIINSFAAENGLTTGAEVCAFLYDYELPMLKEEMESDSNTDFSEVASQAWLLVGNMGEGEKTMSHGFWQANQLTNKGDIMLFYEKSPVKAMNSVWIAQEDGVVDPFFYYYSNSYIGNRVNIPEDKAISFEEFKNSEYFKNRDKKGNFVSKNFQDTSGWAVTRADYNEIKRMLEEKGFDTSVLPKLYEPQKRGEVVIENEADVSEKLVIPMLEEMGWKEGVDFEREVEFNAGRTQTRSADKRPDFCLHLKRKNDDIETKVVIEVKEFMKNENEIHENFKQGRSYAKWGNVKVLVICDLRQLRVYTVDSNHNFKESVYEKFTWDELENDGDKFMQLKKLLS